MTALVQKIKSLVRKSNSAVTALEAGAALVRSCRRRRFTAHMWIVVYVINVATITSIVDFIAIIIVDVIVAATSAIVIGVVIVVVEVATTARKFATQVITQQRF